MKIFIVDDDTDFAQSLQIFLRLDGHEVDLAFDGETAVEQFRRNDYDFTFMDVRLPGMNGVESFFEIRKLKPAAKVMMMTAHRLEDLLQQAVDNGAIGVLGKPLDMVDVLRALERVKPSGIVLVVDDDEDLVEGLSWSLTNAGYTVLLARDGAQAVERARGGNIDCLVLDLKLPVLSGLEVYLKLKQEGLTIPTVIVTGYAMEEADTIDRLRDLCVTGCLVKPVEPEALPQSIEMAMKEDP